jgi:hypothetical protein
MKISSIAYQKLYEVLYEQFVEKTWVNKEQQAPGSDSEKAWLERNPETGNFYFHEFFGHAVENPEHLIRKKKDIKRYNLVDVVVKEPLLFKLCEFIGFQLPEAIVNSHPTTEQKAGILYQLFLEKHWPEHLIANRAKLEVFNHDTGKLIKSSREKKHNHETEAMTDSQVQAAIEEKAVRNLIARFYECISHGKLEEAWECLTPGFRKRTWKDQLEDFTIGYTNTITIRNLHIFDINHYGSGITCKVYYEDDLTCWTSLELGNIEKISVADLEIFVERVKKLKEAAASAGIEGLEKIELQKFFEPAFSEYVWYKCRMKPEDITGLLPSMERQSLYRLKSISCICPDGEWLINAINSAKPHPIR